MNTSTVDISSEAARAGELFNTLLSGMFNEEKHQDTLRNFFAFVVQNPDTKIRWAPVLQAPSACGKNTLVKALSFALGEGGVREPMPHEVRNPFNGWLADCKVVHLNGLDIRGIDPLITKLKPIITDGTVLINTKHKESEVKPNTVNLILSFWGASHLDSDRRFAVLTSHLKDIQDVRALIDTGIFESIYAWFAEQPDSFAEYFKSISIPSDFPVDGPAPSL